MADLAEYLNSARNYLLANPTFAVDPIGTVLRNKITDRDAEVQKRFESSMPADATPMQAMIPRKENIALFLQKAMKSSVPSHIMSKYPELGTALSLAEARAPLQMGAAKRFGGNIQITPTDPAKYSGYFQPETSAVTVVANPNSHRLLNTPKENTSPAINDMQVNFTKMRDFMKTVFHEIGHSDQWNRQKLKKELLTPNKGGTYITPEKSMELVGDHSLYLNQFVEQDARRRGALGEKAAQEVLKLLPNEHARVPFRGIANSVEHDMQKVASFFNQAIRIANKTTKSPEILRGRVRDLKEAKVDALTKMENETIPIPFNFDYINKPKTVLPVSADFASKLQQRLVPLRDYGQGNLRTRALINQMQDAKGVGPMQRWLSKTMKIEEEARQLQRRQSYSDPLRQADWGSDWDHLDTLLKMLDEGVVKP